MDILVGADPELFVMNNKEALVNAHGMVKGTKRDPQPVEFGAVQVDGMALEFNIVPARNKEEFLHNIQAVRNTLQEMIGVNDYSLIEAPSVRFPRHIMESATREALELGCEPDFNAWMMGDVNPSPNPNTNLRTGAGHVHIGWTEGMERDFIPHQMDCIDLVKQLDCSLGIHSILWDDDGERRKLYGNAGAYRVKPYGVEYRVLSNSWLRDPKLIEHVYDITLKATNDFFNGVRYAKDIDGEHIINGGHKVAADTASHTLNAAWGVPILEDRHVR